MQKNPLVSVCMIVKNGMPYVKEALDSVRNQKYQNIELIVQDCLSTDGTVEAINDFAKSVPFPVSLISEKDGGIADAINRAWRRCNGSITALMESDNLFLPNHVEVGVDYFLKNPDVAIIYTSQRMVDESGNKLHDWIPEEYDFEKITTYKTSAASGSAMMQKNILKDDLKYNDLEQYGHVPDHEFWIRVGYKGYKIKRLEDITFCTRLSEKSGSCDVERYKEFAESKIKVIEDFFGSHDMSKWLNLSLNDARIGVLLWAAYHVFTAEGFSQRFKYFIKRAYLLNPNSDRLNDFKESRGFDIIEKFAVSLPQEVKNKIEVADDFYDKNDAKNCSDIFKSLFEQNKENFSLDVVNQYRILGKKFGSDFEKIKNLESVSFVNSGKVFKINIINWDGIAQNIAFKENFSGELKSYAKDFYNWKMEDDDAPILRYIYKNYNPKRHLEFGTWQGYGVNLVLEESDATVWTVNLPFGEKRENNDSAYGHNMDEQSKNEIYRWAERVGFSDHKHNPDFVYGTDSVGFIGRFYLDKNRGNRVCQVYSSSIDFDISNYPQGFFDSILIDGGHDFDTVKNDTKKALALVKEGGLVMWHDFCPTVDFPSSVGVVDYICRDKDYLNDNFEDLFWIYPSFVLVGVKGKNKEGKKFIDQVDIPLENELLIQIKEVAANVESNSESLDDLTKLPSCNNEIKQHCGLKNEDRKKTRLFKNLKKIFRKFF